MYKLLSIHSIPTEYLLRSDITVGHVISCFPSLVSPLNQKSTALLFLVLSVISEEQSQLASYGFSTTQKIKLVGSAVPFILNLLNSKGPHSIEPTQLAGFDRDYDFQVNLVGVSAENIPIFVQNINERLRGKALENGLTRENGIHSDFFFKPCGPNRYLSTLKFTNPLGIANSKQNAQSSLQNW